MKKIENRISDLENTVFTLLIELNKLTVCQTCSELPGNYNEMNLIEDTGTCKDCYDEEYELN